MTDETITKIFVGALFFLMGVFLVLLGVNTTKYCEAMRTERAKQEQEANLVITPLPIKAYKIEFAKINATRIVCAEYYRIEADCIAFIKSRDVVAWVKKDDIRFIETMQNKNSKSEADDDN